MIENEVDRELKEVRKTLSILLSSYSKQTICTYLGVNPTRFYQFLENRPDNQLRARELLLLIQMKNILTSIQ